MTLSPDLIKRLTYSKYLLHRAQQLYEQRAELSVAETVLTMHDAAEMLMGVVTDHLGISPNYAFMEFWSKVSQNRVPRASRQECLGPPEPIKSWVQTQGKSAQSVSRCGPDAGRKSILR